MSGLQIVQVALNSIGSLLFLRCPAASPVSTFRHVRFADCTCCPKLYWLPPFSTLFCGLASIDLTTCFTCCAAELKKLVPPSLMLQRSTFQSHYMFDDQVIHDAIGLRLKVSLYFSLVSLVRFQSCTNSLEIESRHESKPNVEGP